MIYLQILLKYLKDIMKNRTNILLALSWYHPKTHQGVARYAREQGWHLNAYMALTKHLPSGWNGDGVIGNPTPELTSYLRQSDIPASFIGAVPTGSSVPFVCNDNRKVSQLAADYFLKKGFTRFLCYGYARHPRIQFFKEKLIEKGYDCEVLEEKGEDWSIKQNKLSRCLGRQRHPMAVFAIDDNLGSEVIEAALDSSLRIPEDIAVLGVRNDSLICESLAVPLSSVENSLEEVGYEAARLLDLKLQGIEVPDCLEVPPSGVVTRQSSDIMAFDHKGLMQALDFIARNYCEPINVADVANAVTISERALYEAFHRHLGRTIGEEIVRLRMNFVKKQLEVSRDKISVIAHDSGFANTNSFHICFKRQTNMTPNQYRKQNS